MPSLAEKLSSTTPVSVLLRKARRLGLKGTGDFIRLAASRGCRHYASPGRTAFPGPGRDRLPDAELSILLLVGENEYDPMAIRCAAQMMRSPQVTPARLARLAEMEKTGRVLAHIARAGLAHDPEGRAFWEELLRRLKPAPERNEEHLPHWTRFVSMPGRQRHGTVEPRWLTPAP